MNTDYIKSLIQLILNKTFSDQNRKQIITFENRINFCCPVCLDSTKTAAKKRGNLFFNTLHYECFRCGHKTSLYKLCKSFLIEIDPSKKMEMIEYLNNTVNNNNDYKSNIDEININDLINFSDLEKVLNTNKIITEFKPLYKNGIVYNYLLERGINEKFHKNIFQAKHWLNENRYENVIVLLNRKDDKILGMQTRNLKSGKYRSFKIYNFESLYRWVNNIETENDIEGIDLSQLFIYNKLSYFFNILNIDFENTITIFEGYLDSLFFPNSIGVVGTNTDLKILETNNLDIQFFYDNDNAGHKKSSEKIKNEFKVFLWNKLFEEVVNKKKSDDPYTLMNRLSNINYH